VVEEAAGRVAWGRETNGAVTAAAGTDGSGCVGGRVTGAAGSTIAPTCEPGAGAAPGSSPAGGGCTMSSQSEADPKTAAKAGASGPIRSNVRFINLRLPAADSPP
jgi:hypothetical protein